MVFMQKRVILLWWLLICLRYADTGFLHLVPALTNELNKGYRSYTKKIDGDVCVACFFMGKRLHLRPFTHTHVCIG